MEYIKAIGNRLYCGNTPVLLRGFGLGGWFLPEGYMWKFYTKCDRPRKMEKLIVMLCGEDYAAKFWPQYYDRYITKEDIRLIAEEGFNSVRLPINARHYQEMIPRIDTLIDWCREYGIYLILDMHAAPGGQTGQNIDDSADDIPALFTQEKNRKELINLWTQIAARYAHEPVVAGYDLLNEPLPNWQSKYNHMLVPLYENLISAIRKVDKNHLIILEGAHWATDFSVFQSWQPPEGETNLLLQFHKYWSPPDKESLGKFLSARDTLGLPLFMGEGGENNCDWYTAVFALYERLDISWSFWSYKKMDNSNSPISFPVPEGWERLLDYLDGGPALQRNEAIAIFDHFLDCLQNVQINKQVFRALKREAPLTIPCEFYDSHCVLKPRPPGAVLHMQDRVNIQFANGHRGIPDYKRCNGEQQPDDENLVVVLDIDEWLSYCFKISEDTPCTITITGRSDGILKVSCDNEPYCDVILTSGIARIESLWLKRGRHTLRLHCQSQQVTVDTVGITLV